jgi:chromosome segregation ATPase
MGTIMQDPVLYWIIWSIATVFGVIIGWSLRASYRERKIIAAYEHSEQERNSVAHLYSQLRSQHDQKTAEFKKVSIEANQLRMRVVEFEKAAAIREANQQLEAARLARVQTEATHALEKVRLLEENIGHLRTRDAQFVAEINRLHDELNGWKKLQRDFTGTLQQMQHLEHRAAQLDQERTALRTQLDTARLEVGNLQNALALANSSPDGDSDSEDPSGQV